MFDQLGLVLPDVPRYFPPSVDHGLLLSILGEKDV
jgi:hypothetical protein